MPSDLDDLPLFPLGVVLFPGGVLPLRVFEARYLDMVGERMRLGAPFGVCLITRGGEVGEAAEHEAVGCLATITDWDMQQPGVLQIRTIGGERFRVESRRVARDGLVRAQATAIAADAELPVPDAHDACAALLKRIVEDHVERLPEAGRVIAEPFRFESASWVANRLCEFLPIAARAKQRLMELDDPLARLSLVHRYLVQHKVL